MNKYNNGKIYTIRCKYDNNLIYVGSTIQPLYKRWNDHKRNYNKENNKEYNKLLYIKMREFGIDLFYIELYEDYSCEKKEQLNRKEGDIIRQIGTLNKEIAGRTQTEYEKENSKKISETKKKYRDMNKDKLSNQRKEYYIQNKDKFKQYHEENKEQLKAKRKEYYEKNKEIIIMKNAEYRKNKNKIFNLI